MELWKEKIAQMRRQARSFEYTSPGPGSTSVQFTRATQEKHKIGPVGRMSYQDGERIYHAGPSKLEVAPYFNPAEVPSIVGVMDSYADGFSASFDFGEIQLPTRKKETLPRDVQMTEKKLLAHLLDRYGSVDLVNPSRTSMYIMGELTRGATVVCSSSAATYYKSCETEMRSKGYRLTVQEFGTETGGIAYLGSNGCNVQYTRPWVALQVNPYSTIPHSWPSWSTSEDDDGIMMYYSKKDRSLEDFFLYEPDYKRYALKSLPCFRSLDTDVFCVISTEILPSTVYYGESVRGYLTEPVTQKHMICTPFQKYGEHRVGEGANTTQPETMFYVSGNLVSYGEKWHPVYEDPPQGATECPVVVESDSVVGTSDFFGRSSVQWRVGTKVYLPPDYQGAWVHAYISENEREALASMRIFRITQRRPPRYEQAPTYGLREIDEFTGMLQGSREDFRRAVVSEGRVAYTGQVPAALVRLMGLYWSAPTEVISTKEVPSFLTSYKKVALQKGEGLGSPLSMTTTSVLHHIRAYRRTVLREHECFDWEMGLLLDWLLLNGVCSRKLWARKGISAYSVWDTGHNQPLIS